MIHNFLTDSEINRLTELHKVTFCGNCEGSRCGKCTIRNLYTDNNISCERFIEEHDHTGRHFLKPIKK